MNTKRGGSDRDMQFVASLLDGEEGEKVVEDALLNAEVKRDFGVGDTGNVFIEHENWGKPSGIAITNSDYWIFVLDGSEYGGEVFIGINTDRLRRVLAKRSYVVRGGDSKTSKGRLARLSELIQTNSKLNKVRSPKK